MQGLQRIHVATSSLNDDKKTKRNTKIRVVCLAKTMSVTSEAQKTFTIKWLKFANDSVKSLCQRSTHVLRRAFTNTVSFTVKELNACMNPMHLIDYPIGLNILPVGCLDNAYEYLNHEHAGNGLSISSNCDQDDAYQKHDDFVIGKLTYCMLNAFVTQQYIPSLCMLAWKAWYTIKYS